MTVSVSERQLVKIVPVKHAILTLTSAAARRVAASSPP